MAATKFLTAEQLEITADERKHLITIYHHFSRPDHQPEHVDRSDPDDHTNPRTKDFLSSSRVMLTPATIGFNMGFPIAVVIRRDPDPKRHPWSCGAAACIAGHVSLLDQGVQLFAGPHAQFVITEDQAALASKYTHNRNDQGQNGLGVRRNPKLHELYFPQLPYQIWDEISPTKAAQAIENFLTLGDPRWSELMAAELAAHNLDPLRA